MKDNYFSKTKGQSAIEYLMTYGWMLLVVAIVGGAIFATVQGQCTQTTSGFTGTDLQVDNFGLTANDEIQMEIRNAGSDEITLEDDTLSIEGDHVELQETGPIEIGVGGTDTIETDVTDADSELQGISVSEGCAEIDIEFEYEIGELDDQVVDGTLTDNIDVTTS